MMISAALLAGLLACAAVTAGAGERSGGLPEPTVVRLWNGDAPGALGSEDRDIPTITVYRPAPDRATGAAVVICPGGGYAMLADHEGRPIAEWLNTLGVTGVVVKYRLGPRYHHPVMLEDVSRAIRTVRANAHAWRLDPDRIGVLGFSAGGHLASTLATHFDGGDSALPDPIDHESSRPDLAVLIYPVITMLDPYAHAGSRENLLGKEPAAAQIEDLSNDRHVTPQTPPTFLVHTADDAAVPAENSLLFALACRRAGVPVEIHVYEHGPHGFGLGGSDQVLSQWPATCAKWLDRHGFLKRRAHS